MKGLVKIAPTFYSLGNHEMYLVPLEENNFLKMLKDFGVIILNDYSHTIKIKESMLIINGLTDPVTYEKNNNLINIDENKDLKDRLNSLINNHKDFNILLSHRPDLVDIYRDLNIDIVFSGHAHGGQFRIPFLTGLYAPNQGIFPKYTSGIHTLKASGKEPNMSIVRMCVSRGLGNSRFPLRLFNPVLLKLSKINQN